jgi:hypothetical protein
LQFEGKTPSDRGKVISYAKGKSNLKNCKRQEVSSSSEPIVHFGYGKVRQLILWL